MRACKLMRVRTMQTDADGERPSVLRQCITSVRVVDEFLKGLDGE